MVFFSAIPVQLYILQEQAGSEIPVSGLKGAVSLIFSRDFPYTAQTKTVQFLLRFGGADGMTVLHPHGSGRRILHCNAQLALLPGDVQGNITLIRFHGIIGFDRVIQQIAQGNTQIQRFKGIVG